MKLDDVHQVATLLGQLRDAIEASDGLNEQPLALCYQSRYDSTAWRHIVDVDHAAAEKLVAEERARLEAALQKWGIQV